MYIKLELYRKSNTIQSAKEHMTPEREKRLTVDAEWGTDKQLLEACMKIHPSRSNARLNGKRWSRRGSLIFDFADEYTVNITEVYPEKEPRIFSDRPIVYFDLETTGKDVTRDEIIEIALYKIFPDGTTTSCVERVKPRVPICEEAYKIHQIDRNSLEACPEFFQFAARLQEHMQGCYISGYKILTFDLPILRRQLKENGFYTAGFDDDIFIDVYEIIKNHCSHGLAMENYKLTTVYRKICGKPHSRAHQALKDAEVTAEIFHEIVADPRCRVPTLPRLLHAQSVERFFSFAPSRWIDTSGYLTMPPGGLVLNRGKYKGRKVESVRREDNAYLLWILQEKIWPSDTLRILRDHIEKLAEKELDDF